MLASDIGVRWCDVKVLRPARSLICFVCLLTLGGTRGRRIHDEEHGISCYLWIVIDFRPHSRRLIWQQNSRFVGCRIRRGRQRVIILRATPEERRTPINQSISTRNVNTYLFNAFAFIK